LCLCESCSVIWRNYFGHVLSCWRLLTELLSKIRNFYQLVFLLLVLCAFCCHSRSEFTVGCAGACVHVLAHARSSFLIIGLRFPLLILMPLDFWVRALPTVFLFRSCRAPDLCPRGLNFCSFSCQDLQHPVVFSVDLAISCSVSLRSCLASAH
jgi:hypothetical protein